MTPQFCSENFDKTHPLILKALIDANKGFAPSYGKDQETVKAIDVFKRFAGKDDIEVFFCFNGTGANNFAISAVTEKYQAVYCSNISHLYLAESTAPEALSGSRLYPVNSANGKIDIRDLQMKIDDYTSMHSPLPGLLSITQPTEYGTVYTANELKAIAAFCKKNKLLLHIDGARIFNALETMNCSFNEMISITKPDVVTVGGTKYGMMFGEAVLFFNPNRFMYLNLYHKRSMQLASKNRFIASQYNALLKDEFWRKIAAQSNKLAKYFEQQIKALDKNLILYPVETNTVFIKMNTETYSQLIKHAGFYQWNKSSQEARFTFSFSNTKAEINYFVNAFKKLIEPLKFKL